jgi:integrase
VAKGDLSLRQLWELYKKGPKFLGKAPSTQQREEVAAKPLLARLGEIQISAITDELVQIDYADQRCNDITRYGKAVSGDAVRLEIALLSAMLRFAKKRGLLKGLPSLRGIERTSSSQREIRILPDQEVKLYNAAASYSAHRRANDNLLGWLWFVFATGTRPGEAAKIQLEWIWLHDSTIRIPRHSHKTKRPRVILMEPYLKKWVEQQMQYAQEMGSPYLFWSYSTKLKSFVPYRYSKSWRAICRQAGLPDTVVPHGVRHEVISRLFEQGELSDSAIAQMVGDVHVLSLEPYKHLRIHALKPAAAKHAVAMAQMRTEASVEQHQRQRSDDDLGIAIDTEEESSAVDEVPVEDSAADDIEHVRRTVAESIKALKRAKVAQQEEGTVVPIKKR